MYSIKEAADNFKQSRIEKRYEEIANFSIDDIEAHERKLEEAHKETSATMKHEKAKVKNIEMFHPFVKEMKPKDLSTAHLYWDCSENIKAHKAYLAKIEAQQKVYVDEKKAIYEALGFTDEQEA